MSPTIMKRRPRARTLLREFLAGRSFVGLARKYGMTSLAVQAAVRRVSK